MTSPATLRAPPELAAMEVAGPRSIMTACREPNRTASTSRSTVVNGSTTPFDSFDGVPSRYCESQLWLDVPDWTPSDRLARSLAVHPPAATEGQVKLLPLATRIAWFAS